MLDHCSVHFQLLNFELALDELFYYGKSCLNHVFSVIALICMQFLSV
jgi:hypothetical protein